MAGLTGTKIKDTYGDCLQLNNGGAGVTGSLQTVKDGLGNATSFQLSSTDANFTGTVKVGGVAISTTTGTVTSVGLSLPATFTVSNSPVTATGTLTAVYATQAANLVFAGPTSGGVAGPTFRVLVTADLPAGTGTVTSVAMTVPNVLSVAGSPVTTSGTLAVTLATQSANLVFAGPTSGGAVAPTFRALVAADIPTTNALRKRLTADVTNATTTFASLTDLSVTLGAAGTYVGTMKIYCNNSTAAEGIKIDFSGGGATMTSFKATAADVFGGTNVLGTGQTTSLAGVLSFSTITGETEISVDITLVVNAGGTLIPRIAENSHAAGTLTVELGSNLVLFDTAN